MLSLHDQIRNTVRPIQYELLNCPFVYRFDYHLSTVDEALCLRSFLFIVVRFYFQLSKVVGMKWVIVKSGGDMSPASLTPIERMSVNIIIFKNTNCGLHVNLYILMTSTNSAGSCNELPHYSTALQKCFFFSVLVSWGYILKNRSTEEMLK